MSTETNTEMFQQSYETGVDMGYLKALNKLIDFVRSNETFTQKSLLEFIAKEMAGKA